MKTKGFTLVELIVSIAILSIVVMFVVLVSSQMFILTSKVQSKDISSSLAQDLVEKFRSTLTIPDFYQDQPIDGYLRTSTSTLVHEPGASSPLKFLRKVTVVVQGPYQPTGTVTLETFIQTYRPQVSFSFPGAPGDFPNYPSFESPVSAYVSSGDPYLLGWLRDDGSKITKVEYRTRAGGGPWNSWVPLTNLFLDSDCTQPISIPLQTGTTYWFQYYYAGTTEGASFDLQVQATNEANETNIQPSGSFPLSSWANLITDKTKPTINLTANPSPYISATNTPTSESMLTLAASASDAGAAVYRVFVIISKTLPSSSPLYWDATQTPSVEPIWISGGPRYNEAELASGDFHNGTWIYPPPADTSIGKKLNETLRADPIGTTYSIQAVALDWVIGKYINYRDVIPTQQTVLPWPDVNANFQTSNTVALLRADSPSVETQPATSIGYTSVILNGAVNPNWPETTAWFAWGPDQNYGNTTTPQLIGSGTSTMPFSQLIPGLIPDTTYHFKAIASNLLGTGNGEDKLLHTLSFVGEGIIVEHPNGGEVWSIGSAHAITWISFGISGNVKIELSRDSGSTWTETIASSVLYSPGSYDWTVSGPASTACRVRVSSLDNPGVTDSSDSNFTIREAPDITVTSPVGGETWYIGSGQYITWSSVSISGNVKIELSRDSGSTWTETIASGVSYSPGSCPWPVTGPVSATGRVKITSLSDPSVHDESSSNFSITLPPSISVQSPNGGESWTFGSPRTIAWTSVSISGNVKIELSRDGGATWPETIASGVSYSPGSYPWPVTGPASSTCRVRVSSLDNPGVTDSSDSNFTIPPYIQVLAPNGGEVWVYNNPTTRQILWTSSGFSGNVTIQYTTNGGTSWSNIATNEANDGSYTWTIPFKNSTNCKVRITSNSTPSITDMSDSVFTLKKL